MVTNENGEVALRAYQTVQKLIKANGHNYVFVPKHNISLAWIKPEHVSTVLSITRNCNCGGNRNPYFRYADQHDVDIWNGTIGR